MGKSIYLIAFLITAAIFVLAFSFIRSSEEQQIQQIYLETTQLYEELQANKILMQYSQQAGSSDGNVCIVYEKQISRQLNKIYELFNKMEQLEHSTFAVSKQSVRRQYLLTSMSLWLDLQAANENCSFSIRPVLYFFPNDSDCVLCSAMQNQLEVLKQSCPEARVFAFPSDSNDFEFVSLLKNQYDVNASPALVVKDQVFTDMQETEYLEGLLGCHE